MVLKTGPHKGRTPYTVDLCSTCIGFITYQTTGDWSLRHPQDAEQESADYRHARSMVKHLGVTLAHVTAGCGRECDEHGEAAYDSPEAYLAALEERDTETWFSNSPCEGCGALAGQRQHGTIFVR